MNVQHTFPARPWSREVDRPIAFDPFSRMHREMDRVFEDVLSDTSRPWYGPRFDWWGAMTPSLDMSETPDGLEIYVDLPGMDVKDVTLTLREGMLWISGERKDKFEEKKKDFYRSERKFGSFVRSVLLPYDVDAEHIDAHFENGVLRIMLPKSPEAEAKERRIKIKAH